MKKSFYETKGFAVAVLFFGVFGLLLVCHHVASYEAILRPYMDFLIENRVITNDVNGMNFLYFFTYQSNIFVDLFLVLYAIGILGNKKMYDLTHNEKLRGAVTLYIFITGIIYCGVLLPFATASFPMEKGIWFSNVNNVWSHLIVPLVFTIFWFFPVNEKKIPVTKTALTFLIYPIAYLIFSLIRGAYTDFYPYPFLNSKQLWSVLLADKPFESGPAMVLLIVVIAALAGFFFAVGSALCAIHNKIVEKRIKE